MAARTCLLCGKPLSRIWAGTGEDFCSREHRNQYRLRRGMDRLLEANKVANVMRRRESPRQIPAETLRSAGSLDPRGFLEALRTRVERPPVYSPPLTRLSDAALTRSSECLPARPIRGVGDPRAGVVAAKQLFAPRPPAVPITPGRLESRMAQAPASPVGRRPANSKSKRRAESPAWRPGARPSTTGRMRRAAPAAASPIGNPCPPRAVMKPAEGRPLRVSMAAGFRIPERKEPAAPTAAPVIAGIRWPGFRILDRGAAAAQPSTKAADAPFGLPAMRIPAGSPWAFQGRFRWPGAQWLAIHFVDSDTRQRTAFVPFGKPDESAAKERR